ncbi:ATP-binding protein (plasmid) [Streptomyces sp. NBC_00841]|uniref:AlbA family DNA-binding domain-containing protein n=1 Tax=unclassified Streptomyces TaxID=2593676 RepID=UPI00225BDDB2|nr:MULTISPECIES: ATP-binding protein [unclassified Streptomyces]MCX4538976.1 ATP-binding protein [Streptomyces sp. NBC_01669]WSA04792.1 ATP-binding protein [Streptomyces sp. NBC_00841]
MARSWTRLHEHLGAAPGPLSFDMVRQAAADNLAESDDLDWKEKLPQPPRDGRWNELAKDVAAMANTRGGLLIFGVRDKTTELVGIDPGEVNVQQYAQWIRNHVQPYLPDLTFSTLTAPDGTASVLVVDVPASAMAPHHVYGTSQKDKEQQAAVVPYRDKDHTAWMAEHQIERAYRDRFTHAQRAEEEVQRLLGHVQETVFAQQKEPAAWFFAVARPDRPLPRTAPRLAREDATNALHAARARTQTRNRPVVGPLAGLEIVSSNPRPGLRRWVLNTLTLGAGREIYAELHHDGSVVLAVNLSWKAIREGLLGEAPEEGLLLHQDFVGECCRDLAAIAVELARRLRVDSALHLTAAIAAAAPAASLAAVVSEYGGFMSIPDYARRPHRIQPVAATLTPVGKDEALGEAAQELFTDLMTQFGLDPQL